MYQAIVGPPKEPLVASMSPGWMKFFAVLGKSVYKQAVYAVSISPGSIGANSTKAVAVAVGGVKSGQVVTVNRTAAQSGIGVGNAWASDTDEITVEFFNVTAGAIDPGAQALKVHVI